MSTPDELRSVLARTAGDQAAAQAAGKKLITAARERLEQVDRELTDLRPATLTSEAAARRYSDLIEERGQLNLVIAGG